MQWRKIGKSLLFPKKALLVLLLPISSAALVYAMLYLTDNDPLRIAAYVMAFYTLVIWCARVPKIIDRFKSVKNENRYAVRWQSDPRLRVNVSLGGSLVWNGAYALFQLGLGIYHRSFWYYSLAAYYFSLAVMRLLLVRHSARHRPGEKMRDELKYYRVCGGVFLVMNIALSVMMFCMISQNREVTHNEITVIANAAYTFFTLTKAIVNVIKYRKYNSPVFSASKAISLAAACVSMLTLEETMLTTFGRDSLSDLARLIFLSASGGAVSVIIVAMAAFMLVQSGRKLKILNSEKESE